jgi:MurNAc alpha-1-phosphate uridylyltransferase
MTVPASRLSDFPPAAAALSQPRRAIILAAGLGERMRPLTDALPKPLLEVGGRAMIDWALDRLAAGGVEEAVVNLFYRGEQIRAHLAGRTHPRIVFSEETVRLETGGGTQQALPLLGEAPFLAVNADMIWLDGPTPALERMAARWDDEAMDCLLLLHSAPKAMSYDGRGDFTLDPLGRLKRRKEREIAPFVYAGVQIVHPRLFADAPGGAYSFNLLFDRAMANGRGYGLVHDGAWFHIGTPQALAEADPLLNVRNARWLELS